MCRRTVPFFVGRAFTHDGIVVGFFRLFDGRLDCGRHDQRQRRDERLCPDGFDGRGGHEDRPEPHCRADASREHSRDNGEAAGGGLFE